MNRRGFREQHLGSWSSHPAWLATRTRRWMLLGGLPLLGGLGFLFFLWRFGAITLLSLATEWDTWLPFVLGLVVMGFSAATTVVLVARASTVKALQPKPGEELARDLPVWSFVLGTALVAGLAFALTRSGFLAGFMSADGLASVRLAGHLLGTLPLFVLLVFLEFAGHPVDEWGRGGRTVRLREVARRSLSVLGILAGFVLPMLWIDRVSTALDLAQERGRDPIGRSLESVESAFRRWVPWGEPAAGVDPADGATLGEFLGSSQHVLAVLGLLIPLGCMVYFVVTTAFVYLPMAAATEEPVEPDEIAREEGYLLRPAGECWDPNGKSKRPEAKRWRAIAADDRDGVDESEGADEQKTSAEIPAWLELVREVTDPEAGLEWGEPRRLQAPGFSPSSGREDLAHLFGTAIDPETGTGRLPTRDQVGALEQFDRLFEEFLKAEDREGQGVFPSMDLLVTGAPGSGRTTLLLAVAMNSVVLRGQSVLILVPTPEKVELFVRRLRDLASRSGVGWHVAVGPIRNDDVRQWADKIEEVAPRIEKDGERHRSPVGSLPDILVGTPQDYERHLYGADHHFPVVRRSLLRMQVVLLEDISSFSPKERRHLPFLVEKHRLVLASEHLPVQFLAIAPNLTDQAKDYFGERLFTEKARVPSVSLRPPRQQAPWGIEVVAGDPGLALEALAQAASEIGVPAVLWRPGSDAADRKRLEARLSTAHARVRVVGDLDELDPDELVGLDLAIYRSGALRHPELTLAARIEGGDSVLVCVTAPGAASRRSRLDRALPVLPSVHSESFFVAHLASALRFLAPGTPIPRDAFARSGFRTVGDLLWVRRRDRAFAAFPGCTLILDPPETEARGYASARGQDWPWVAVEHVQIEDGHRGVSMTPRPVELLRPLERGRSLRADHDVRSIYLGEVSGRESAIAAWSTQQGETLDRMDLAYAENLLHGHGSSSFFPNEIRPGAEGMSIRGTPYRDRGVGESYLPIWDFRLRLPIDVSLELDQSGVAPDSARWSEVQPSRDASHGAEVQYWLSGTFDELGQISSRGEAIPFHFDTRVGLWLLGQQRSASGTTVKQRDETTRSSLATTWETRFDLRMEDALESGRARPWPLLGLALSSALRESLIGIFEYGRMAAFHAPADGVNNGRAFLLFLEPEGTRGTVASAMRKLLLDADLLTVVLGTALGRIEDLHHSRCDAIAGLRVAAGSAVGSDWYDETDLGRALYRFDREAALELLASVRDEIDRGRPAPRTGRSD